MLLTYKEANAQSGGQYGLRQAVKSGKIRHLARNLYATEASDSILGSLAKLYPDAIVTGSTALYLHDLIDLPPESIDVVTKRGGTKITNPAIRQSYIPQEWLQVGATTITYDGVEVNVFDLERTLLELMRSRNKLPYKIYREAVNSYRKLINRLDVYKLEEYADLIPRGQSYFNRVLEEVF
ncbi:hypothetical protein [Adlercreutzia sp. ZJ154]|uniref:type IV toxin-antitoxin system AbiEi family antitoxin domain-containing protein n=1 Tax=Adlercreutzia sp. ZJ154 TaxID=2709790 RepID=UPI0013EA819C|nr:hypothetical protein [Adlercreutzia sp. ZJ154]